MAADIVLRPCHVMVNWQSTVSDYLSSISDSMLRTEELGEFCDNVKKAGDGCGGPCKLQELEFGTTFVVLDGSMNSTIGEEHQTLWNRDEFVVECVRSGGQRITLRCHANRCQDDVISLDRVALQFEHIARQLCASGQKDEMPLFSQQKLSDLGLVCFQDKSQIWKWNASVSRTIDCLVQDMFLEIVKVHPHRIAVDAWDGALSYSQLDEKSSALGLLLSTRNIAVAGQVVPLYFEKTVWTTITILAVAKAGSIFVLLDPQQPTERIKSIIDQLGVSCILARPETLARAQSLAARVVVVDDALLRGHVCSKALSPPSVIANVNPAQTLYIVFTSGSTGQPKGVQISHRNLCSAVTYQARELGFTDARTLDSSSYSFDAYVFNTFYTLLSAGCLCVCTDVDRMNRLQSVLQDQRITLVQLTPSLAQVLDPASLPHLQTLILTGEKLGQTVLGAWICSARTRLINAYGPTECTIMCAANLNVDGIENLDSIGQGIGATLWIADVNNINRLAPIGAIGELVIEGPLIGLGYLGDENNSYGSLIDPPDTGYLAGVTRAPQAKLFRTGDLARYNGNGTISYIGRSDTQIKINGQRVEVSEIEHWLGQYWPHDSSPVVEAIHWPSGVKQLVAFVVQNGEQFAARQRLRDLITQGNSALASHLPRYMIPSAYFPLQHIPMTASGKKNRRALRNLALGAPDELLEAVTGKQVEDSMGAVREMSDHELRLRQVWAAALHADESSVQLHDNFFAKGDSLAAVKLISLAHKQGMMDLTVADVFRHPKLVDLAAQAGTKAEQPQAQLLDLNPFSMLAGTSNEVEILRAEISKMTGCGASQIQDAYLCSPIQEEMMALAAMRPRDFITHEVLRLPDNIVLSRLLDALQQVAVQLPILRTRILDVGFGGEHGPSTLVQDVIDEPVPLSWYMTLEACLVSEKNKAMELGDALFRLGVVKPDLPGSTAKKEHCVVLVMHHAIYDGWFLNLLMQGMKKSYEGDYDAPLLPYRNFIQYLISNEHKKSADFWLSQLNNTRIKPFPVYPSLEYKPSPGALCDHCIPLIPWNKASNVTPSTFIQAAWSILLASYSGSSSVVFGTTVLGRQIPLTGVERIGGPTIAAVPICIQVKNSMKVVEFLQTIQMQMVEMIDFSHFGIRNMKRLSHKARMATDFRTFLVVQPPVEDTDRSFLSLSSGSEDITAFNTYALMLECSLGKDCGVRMRASFDQNILSGEQVRSMMKQLEGVLGILIIDCHSYVSDAMAIAMSGSHSAVLEQPNTSAQMEEIENSIRGSLPPEISDVAVTKIDLPLSPNPVVAFFEAHTGGKGVLERISAVYCDQARHLPRYNIPNHYLTLEQLPRSSNGQLDRISLKKWAEKFDLHQFRTFSWVPPVPCQLEGQVEGEMTDAEAVFRRLWADSLNIPMTSVHRNSSFIFLGGDSLAAMKLVAAARKSGYSTSVAQILEKPALADMAASANLNVDISAENQTPKPFSLLKPSPDPAGLALMCNVDRTDIEDAYPCSPLQESMMTRTIQRGGDYVSQGLVQLSKSVDIGRLQRAWHQVATLNPILRTRIIDWPGSGLLQVEVNKAIDWLSCDTIDDVPENSMGLGRPLIRLCIIKSMGERRCLGPGLLLTAHHAIYDRWSMSLILRAVESIYLTGTFQGKLSPYNEFIRYLVEDFDHDFAKSFWTEYLSGLSARQFPVLPSQGYQPTTDAYHNHSISSVPWPVNNTPTTVLKASWALVVSLYTNCDDVLFGMTVMGRQGPVPNSETIAGPTIATIPIRVRINWPDSPRALLQDIQSHAAMMIPAEQYGLGRIRRLNGDTKVATQFQSLVIVHPSGYAVLDDQMIGLQLGEDIEQGDSTAITIEFAVDNEPRSNQAGVALKMTYDSKILELAQVQRIACLTEHVLRQLCEHSGTDKMTLAKIDMLTRQDRETLWQSNLSVPPTCNNHLGNMLVDCISNQGLTAAVCAWDGELSNKDLSKKARRLAYTLVVCHGVSPGIVVAICSVKSVWTPVAMLAVLISGGTAMMIDPSQEAGRLKIITKQAGACLILTTTGTGTVAEQIASHIVVIDNDLSYPSSAWKLRNDDDSWIPPSSPTDSAYIIFTSGSTGVPKAAAISHKNCCSAIIHQNKALGFKGAARVLDLSSYAFDVCWEHFFQTIYAGGCICIPTDHDCVDDIATAITRLGANFLQMTPSLARTLEPSSISGIEIVMLSGEACSMHDVTRWGPAVEVRIAYGPCECTPTTMIATYGKDFLDKVNLGLPYGVNAWILSSVQPDTLAPVGGEGELVVEGPLVGQGYINSPRENSESFLSDPEWLLRGSDTTPNSGRRGLLYRTGDLVRTDSRGRLHFLGRKDSQIKIRGQRVELEEVETHVRDLLDPDLQVAVDVIEDYRGTPEIKSQSLMLFIAGNIHKSLTIGREEAAPLIRGLIKRLSTILPRYMIPSGFILLEQIPFTRSGKIDRRVLRQIGCQKQAESLRSKVPGAEPSTDIERKMAHSWAQALGISPQAISRQDSFFELGGDSLTAIHLVGIARNFQLTLSVVMIFQNPNLEDMAKRAEMDKVSNEASSNGDLVDMKHEPRFDGGPWLPKPSEVSKMLHADAQHIGDILPVTDFQAYAIRCNLAMPRTEWNYFALKFQDLEDPEPVNEDQIRRICHALVERIDIFRTIFLRHQGGYFQMLLDRVEPHVSVSRVTGSLDAACKTICQQDLTERLNPALPFIKFFIVRRQDAAEACLVIGLSHACYDGISLPYLAECIGALHDRRPLPQMSSFFSYLKDTMSQAKTTCGLTFWRSVLKGSPPPTSLSPNGADVLATNTDRCRLEHQVVARCFPKKVTAATFFIGALAVSMASVSGQDEIILGRGVSGRALAVERNHYRVIGPCLNIIPARINCQNPEKIIDMLMAIQEQFIAAVPHETLGLSDIVRHCTDWAPETQYGCVFYYQSAAEPVTRIAGHDEYLTPLQLVRADPPEPLRVDVTPRGGDDYLLEISTPSLGNRVNESRALLDCMVHWVSEWERTRPVDRMERRDR
ncbi:Nonribosomal peptide synthetase 6 [Metarhizium brunneum]|uniref:Nonribosomal peptide synthetase 6 n=1 Tax=Metarhizium brunneum TaxID=500148 RepID=A0A7D5V5W9_9HYPO